MIIIASHARFGQDNEPTHGTGSEISAFLQKEDYEHFFIKHSLYNGFSSLIEKFSNGKIDKQFCGFKNLPFILRIIQEQLINFYFIFKIQKPINLFIGIDPLNAFSGVLAQKTGKVKKTVFYTADYACQRFRNPIVNSIYHWFDRFGIKNVDQVWNVSTRITKLRKKQGVPKEKNFFVPNTPDFRKIKHLPYSKINKHDLVVVSHLTQAIDYFLVFKVVKELSQKYKDIRLLIIGTGPYEKELKKLVQKLKISDKILFLGRKPHDEVLKILPQSAVGLALYTKEQPWTEFGDSMKIREYLACGLPVITTSVTSTADDIKKAGVGYVIELKKEDFEEAIDKLFFNRTLYLKMRKNAIKLASNYTLEKIFIKALRETWKKN